MEPSKYRRRRLDAVMLAAVHVGKMLVQRLLEDEPAERSSVLEICKDGETVAYLRLSSASTPVLYLHRAWSIHRFG